MSHIKEYGVYNTRTKEFQFGIRESSKSKARQRLYNKIGKDSYRWRFEIREIKPNSKFQELPEQYRRRYRDEKIFSR